ncbi:Ribbon-helix-helix protein, copG family [Yokenella regensburgei]|nr:Ribbon-helix-helix protein, copG family [Yokenella regensburgei]
MSLVVDLDMGRILIDLSDDVIQRLDNLKQLRNQPRAELLREAIEQYLDKQGASVIREALGLWGIRKRMGLNTSVNFVMNGDHGAYGSI